MAIKIVSGGRIEDSKEIPIQKSGTSDLVTTPSLPSDISNILRNLTRATSKGVESVLDLPANLQEFARYITPESVKENMMPVPTIPRIGTKLRESILEPLLGKEYFQPQGEPGSWQRRGEETLDTLGQYLTPIPGLGAPKFGTALAGALGSQTAKELGFGELGQAAGGLIGGGTKSLAGFWRKTSPMNLAKRAAKTYKENYPVAEQAVKGLKSDASIMENKLSTLIEEAGSQKKGETDYSKIIKNIKDTLNKTGTDKTASIADMIKERKRYDKLINDYRSPSGQNYRDFYIKARSIVNDDFLKKAEKELPEWGKPWRKAEDTWMLSELPQNLKELFKKHTSDLRIKNLPWIPILTSALGGSLHYAHHPIQAALVAVGGLTAKKAYDLIKKSMGKPTIQGLLKDIAREASEGNIKNLKGHLAKFNDKMEEMRKETEGVTVVSGGRLND